MLTKSLLLLALTSAVAWAQSTTLSAGQKFYFSSPSYPNSYAPGSSFNRYFTTGSGGKLNLVCVYKIPSTDGFLFNLNAATFANGYSYSHTYGNPFRSEWNSTSNGLAVGLKSSTSSTGGFVNCVVTALGSTPIAEPPMNTTCGVKASSINRIVNGVVVPEYEIPWQVRLTITSSSGATMLCGGTIIAPDWILTAAHCTVDAVGVKVTAGQYNRMMPTLEQQEVQASVIKNHEDYNEDTLNNDVSLLKLRTPLKYNNAVRPVCLPYTLASKEFNGEVGTTSGWGQVVYGGSTSEKLLKVSLPIYDTTACRLYPSPYNYITDNMICAYKLGADSCKGDSGGPLTWQDPSNGRTYLIGVVSYSFATCANPNSPGVYAKVSKYLSWIENNTGATFCKV